MNSAFNLVDFDDGPTLVMAHAPIHTEVMDRRHLPAQFSPPVSGVMPVARPFVPVDAVAPNSHPPRSADATQPALRVRRDLQGSRRLVVALAIGFAFVFGIAASFGSQVLMSGAAAAAPAPLAARSPRTVTDRSSTLDTRSTPDAVPRMPDAPAKPKRKSPSSPTATDTEPNVTPPPAEETAESLEGRDLLGEGLGATN